MLKMPEAIFSFFLFAVQIEHFTPSSAIEMDWVTLAIWVAIKKYGLNNRMQRPLVMYTARNDR